MHLHIACNDEACGVFAERAAAICIGSIELEAMSWPEPRFLDFGDRIRLAGKNWPVIANAEWVGNWCWNAFTLSDGKSMTERHWLMDFAIWLRGRRLYSITTGPEGFFDWWNFERDASPAEVHSWICDAIEENW